MHRILPLAVPLLALGCSEFGLADARPLDGRNAPDIVIDPPALQFARLRAGEAEVQSFAVRNEGREPLVVADMAVSVGFAFEIVDEPASSFTVAPGESFDVEVAFTPMGQDDNFGEILVFSNDPDTPEAPVQLLGRGDVPDLVITPGEHQFGESFVPCGDDVVLELRNVGTEELVITNMDYTSLGGLSADLASVPLPLRLSSGSFTNLTVTWEPMLAGAETGTLAVTSNDPLGIEKAYQNGEGAYVNETTEVFTEPSDPAVDVIFLIDQSCSMQADNEATLAAGIPGFFAKLRELSDWQLIQVTKGNGCGNGGIIDAATPDAETKFQANAFGWSVSDTVSEALLEHASLALANTAPGGCNEGAVRDGALLHVIIASDEPEQSGIPWQTHLADIETYVADPSLLRVSGIVDINGVCGLSGSPTGPGGYQQAANATGGALLNICSTTWGNYLPDLAAQVLEGVRTYSLSQPALPSSIRVTVNGTPTTAFTYGEGTNAITIDDPPVGEGDVVEVTYAVAATCR